MNKNRLYQIGFFLLVFTIALFAVNCITTPDPDTSDVEPEEKCKAGASDRTEGCDEFKKWSKKVNKNSQEFTSSDWHPLAVGDKLTTDLTGEAELNFPKCWPGRIFIFRDSKGDFSFSNCDKNKVITKNCVRSGSWYFTDCGQEFTVQSGSVIVQAGSTFVITYLPEFGDYQSVSIVTVLEGEVVVEPVDSFDPHILGERMTISGGEFVFTMPTANMISIAGLEPRTIYSVERLPLIDEVLGIWDWMVDAYEKGLDEDVIPANWPPEFTGYADDSVQPIEPPIGGDPIVLNIGGGVLNDVRLQEALLIAIDWAAIAGNEQIMVDIDDQPFDVYYDQETSKVLFDEGGYDPEQIGLTLMYPMEDSRLEEISNGMAEYLSQLGMAIEVLPVYPSEIEDYWRTYVATGVSAISITW